MEGPQEPIEVELVSNDGAGHDRARPGDADEQRPIESGPVAARTGWAHSEMGRLSVVAAVAAAFALLVGWALGRSTAPGDDPVATTIPAAAATPSTATTVDTIAPVESTATSTVAVTSAPTSAIPDPPVGVRTVEIDAALAGQPIEVVSVLSSGRLAVLDVGAATLDERPVERPPFGPGGIRVGAGWVLLPSWDDDLAWTMVRGDEPETSDLGSANRILHVVGSDTFWRLDDELLAGRPGVAEELRFDGIATGATLAVPGRPELADPAGGLLVPTVGGVFRVSSDGVSQLSSGELLGVGSLQAVVFECDAELGCDYQLVERGSGTRTAVVPSADPGVTPQFVRPWWPLASSALSADASAIITVRTDGRLGDDRDRPTLGVLDLASGEFRELTAARTHTSIGWSPDGAFVFFADGGRLFAFVRASGDIVNVTGDLFAVEAFGVRSTTP